MFRARVRPRIPLNMAAFACAAAFAYLLPAGAPPPSGGTPRALPRFPRASAPEESPAHNREVQVVERGSYPELHVGGKPFFVYSAEFLYPRIPRSLWESSLERYHGLGINTISLSIPWNWHEPREGEFDFNGHTNARRDLRALLGLIANQGFKLIARPGPGVLREWRNGGYPDWLLERPEYHMPLADRLEGRAPPEAELEAADAEAAARLWLENRQHMAHVSAWLQAVARELAPYRPSARVSVAERNPTGEKAASPPREVPGPLLFVQVGDGLGSGRANRTGREFWKYVEALCSDLARGGVEVPCTLDAAEPAAAAAGSAHTPAVAALGQWFPAPASDGTSSHEMAGPSGLSGLAVTAASLATQPAFPPILAAFDPASFAPQDDARPAPGFPEDTGFAAHILLAEGIHGMSWFPLQDTLTPAGYGVPGANRSYRWDAPLSISGERQPGVREVERIGNWLSLWGNWVAASHPRADFGLVDTLASLPSARLTTEDAAAVTHTLEQVQRLAQYAGLTSEMVDPEFQPPSQLLRNALLLLPIYRPADPSYSLSHTAQQALAAYVRGGGVLVCFPGPPEGAEFAALEQGPEVKSAALPEGTRAWRSGAGRLVVLTKDFYSWIPLEEDIADAQQRFEAPFARSLLHALLADAGVRPSVRRADSDAGPPALLATELISDKGTLPLGRRSGGEAWLSAINPSYDATVSETLEVLSPHSSAREDDASAAVWISIPVTLPPRESLLLPVDLPLCLPADADAAPDCTDRVTASSAELLEADHDGKLMYLTLYSPVKSTIRLHLAGEPDHIEVDDARAEAHWDKDKHELEVEILRGASPDYQRVVRVPLSYRPSLPVRSTPDWRHRAPARFRFRPAGAARLPLGTDSSLLTNPPLYVISRGSDGSIGVVAENLGGHDDTMEVEAAGPFNTSAHAYVGSGEIRSVRLKLPASAVEKAGAGPPGPDGLYHGTLHFSAGPDSQDMPAAYALVPAEGTAGYRFDFDADGSDEWVLENSATRAIFSPAAGGRLIALWLKSQEQNVASTMGLLEDAFSFTPNPAGAGSGGARGDSGTFNRDYAADWVAGRAGPSLHQSYDAPDVYPHGARIEKTAHFSSGRKLDVEYRVALLPADAARRAQEAGGQIFAAPPPAEEVPQSFEILNSIPAEAAEASRTEFCWAAAGEAAGADHCEGFVRGAAAMAIPAGVHRVEIRRPRHAGLAVAWDNDGVRATLEPRNYSVLLRLVFPPLAAGGAAGAYRIEFTVEEAQ